MIELRSSPPTPSPIPPSLPPSSRYRTARPESRPSGALAGGDGTPRLSLRSHVLTAADDTTLRLLALYQFLSADQVRRLRDYHAGSLDYVRRALKRLAQEAWALRVRLPRASAGNAPWVYGLDHAGVAYLLAAGVDPLLADSGRFRASEQYEKSYLFLAHTLAVNDFLIAATLLERQTPEVRLAAMRHEHELKRTPVRVALGVGEQQVVIPDGWLDFHLYGRSRLCVTLELDRGTEEERMFKRKIRALLAYAAGPYQEAFGTDSLTIAFATTAGERRVERLRVWCEQVLRAQGQQQDADLFYLTAVPEGELDPRRLFLSPVWTRPFASTATSLLSV